MKRRLRLDDLLVLRGHDLNEAKSLILSGLVFVDGRRETRAGIEVSEESVIEVRQSRKYVSRSALKLIGAIREFRPEIANRICIDLGASTGGFTQVLLEAGARRVYAVDVAYGILDYSIRSDERVVVLERRNVREIAPDWFREAEFATEIPFIVCDISFMSLRTVLDSLRRFADGIGISFEGIFLLKPQFEASDRTQRGVITDEVLRSEILDDFLKFAVASRFKVLGVAPADIRGAKGNQEYTVYLKYPA
jgi:23S rRNA (cytidine1920-2'-O)/16S rRNA (cytidine1409-2'-O)-methyltransferase